MVGARTTDETNHFYHCIVYVNVSQKVIAVKFNIGSNQWAHFDKRVGANRKQTNGEWGLRRKSSATNPKKG